MRIALLFALTALFAQAQHAAGCVASFSSPGWNGACYLAVPLAPTQGLYSWTMAQKVQGSILTSTGLALVRPSFTNAKGTLYLWGVGTVGAAGNTFVPSGGGGILWVAKARWTFILGGLTNVTQKATTTNWISGPGLSW